MYWLCKKISLGKCFALESQVQGKRSYNHLTVMLFLASASNHFFTSIKPLANVTNMA